MTVEGVKHSPILSALFRMTEDCELLGAAEFIKGNFCSKKYVQCCGVYPGEL